MSPDPKDFLESCRPEGTTALRSLIEVMIEKACPKVMLTDHPDYGFRLGVANTDIEKVLGFGWVSLVEDFSDRYQRFHGIDEEKEEEKFDDYASRIEELKWEWIHRCWIDAQGRESGRIVILFENGIGDTMDLSTGEEADNDLFQDLK